MALAKQAQSTEKQDEFDKFHDIIEGLDLNDDSWDGGDLSMATDDLYVKEDKDDEATETTDETTEETEGEGKVTIQVGDEDPITEEFQFEMPMIPGGLRQNDMLEDLIIEEPEDEIQVQHDPWEIGEVKNTPQWAQFMVNNTPKHSGRDILGLDRAIAYLTQVGNKVSKKVQSDINGCLDISMVQDIKNKIDDGIKRLEERKERLNMWNKKKKAEADPEGFKKEAQHAFGVSNGVTITVPLIVSRIVRVIINGMVSGGHDAEHLFEAQCKQYDLTKREQAEVLQLLEDMHFPIRRDRFLPPGPVSDYHNGDHGDWGQQFNN